jgi:hypothetical protein
MQSVPITICAVSCEFESHSWRGVLDTTLYDKVGHAAAVYQWCEFKPRRGKNKNLTALKSNSSTVWFNFQTYIYIYIYNNNNNKKHIALFLFIRTTARITALHTSTATVTHTHSRFRLQPIQRYLTGRFLQDSNNNNKKHIAKRL